jgi:hypothetical protein
MKHYKLRVQTGGDIKTDSHWIYYDSLDGLVGDVFDMGIKGFPVIGKSYEISKEEYEQNYLPI